MTLASLVQLGLRLRLTLIRYGWGNSFAAVLCVLGALAWLWGLPQLKAQANTRNAALLYVHKALGAAPATVPEPAPSKAGQRLHDFYDTLGEQHDTERQIETMFALAAKNGLILSQAEYKLTYDRNGRFRTYRILLPLKGSYSAIRQFCEQVLLSIPFVSLDEMHFKRESIANPQLEAKLHFTVYLNTQRDGVGVSPDPLQEREP
ncbi:hypothetical protein SAMN04515618_1148 [Collimonas sp. OK307]|uniref:hypothetical protein n=1 Tax=Collimonas sp. OK307 TaxID=1801620 RepID=UPI0008E06DD5|nr:hypothetical protein [Collimonas sp. OK307]SFI21999.1 hypothetical protein SAMN04515618_1148 [Collimonas sp. OK307]